MSNSGVGEARCQSFAVPFPIPVRMGQLWTDEMEAEHASQQPSENGPPSVSSSEPIQSKDLLFRDVLRGSLAYFLTALRYRLLLAALPSRSLADEINDECGRREFAEWIAIPIPDPPGLEAIDA